MKKTTISGISLLLFLLVHAASAQTTQQNPQQNTDKTALNGAWERFYHHDAKTTTTGGAPKEFVIVSDGFFSGIGQDSTGLPEYSCQSQ